MELDLNKSEEEAYHSLLAFGQLSFGEFCYYNNLEINEGTKLLNQLVDKGLAGEIKGLANRYIPKFPFLSIAKQFKEPVVRFNQLKTEMESFLSNKEKEIKTAQESKLNEIDQELEPKIKTLQEIDSQLHEKLEQGKVEFDNQLKQTEGSIKTNLEELKNKSASEFTSKKSVAIETAFSKATSKKEEVLKASKDYQDANSSLITDFYNQLDTSIKAELESSFSSIKNTISALKTEINQYQKSFQKKTNSLLKNSQAASIEYLKESGDAFTTTITKTLEYISEEKEALKILDLSLNTSSFESLDVRITRPLLELRNMLVASKKDVQNFKDSFDTAVSDLVIKDKEMIFKTVQSVKSDINETLVELKTDLRSEQENSNSKINNYLEESKKRSDELISGIISSINVFKEDFISSINQLAEKGILTQEENTKSKEKIISKMNTELKTKLDNFTTSTGELRNEFLKQGISLSQEHTQSLLNSITNSTPNLVKAYESVVAAQEQHLQELVQSTASGLDNRITTVQNSFDEFSSEFQQSISDTETNLTTKLGAQEKELTTSEEKMITSYLEIKAKLEKEYSSNTLELNNTLDMQNSTYYDEILVFQNTLLNDLGQLVDSFQSNLSDLSMNTIKELLSIVQDKFNILSSFQTIISEKLKSAVEQEKSIKQLLSTGATEQAQLVQQSLKDHTTEFEKLIKVGEDLLTPSASLLEEFDGIIKAYPFPKINSAGLIGWASSLQLIHEMIGRMKSRVTMLFPDPDDIPLDLISETKRPKRIDLSSNFDLASNEHKTLARRLLEQDNVTLRNIEIRSGGEIPPFLACDIDGEEVLFGTQDPENKTAFVGMHSTNESFVQLTGKVFLSDFLSRAKLIKRDDL